MVCDEAKDADDDDDGDEDDDGVDTVKSGESKGKVAKELVAIPHIPGSPSPAGQ